MLRPLGQDVSVRDFDRPLNGRGQEDSSRMGVRVNHWPKPEVVISSPAMRAKTTAKILAMAMDYSPSSITFEERIYEAELDDLLSVIRAVDDKVASVMLVGHNPALTHLVNVLGQCDIGNMPTCSIALLHILSDSWDDTGTVKAELRDFIYPEKEGDVSNMPLLRP